MIIQKISLFKLTLPLKHPFITNKRYSTDMTSLLFKVVLDDDTAGWGEAAENKNLTGDDFEAMFADGKTLSSQIVKQDAEAALRQLAATDYLPVKYGLETAVLDAVCRSKGQTIAKYLQLPAAQQRLENDTTISIMDAENMLDTTTPFVVRGYKHLKYKIGPGKDEIARLQRLEQLLPEGTTVRIDPNQAWEPAEAMNYLQLLADSSLKIDFIEQPVAVEQTETMQALAAADLIPIVADEAVFTLADAKKIIAAKSANMLNIKLIKCGGPLEAVQIAQYAAQHQVDCMFGCTSEANIAITMAAKLSASLSNVKFYDLDGLDFIKETPFMGGVIVNGPELMLPDTHGLGITVNESSPALQMLTEVFH
ncbi:MAG: mandelate racemase [Lactobacillus sp.]|jgi:L-alanine-DL-glutamate epimerase-like enolase superfamily enzyme|nr:mandelate racemase [Lactobacillus sp.]MCH3905689.1 mandelate racemase [Lactobacillus sp.]MCH3990742.1 mandelate racemase [Lactobacillus sp.]MCH4068542.1 mandelate racemase [Lactobacillus sp.]MCI1304163.1 mandelate racemase [Lactobacillus sp.]